MLDLNDQLSKTSLPSKQNLLDAISLSNHMLQVCPWMLHLQFNANANLVAVLHKLCQVEQSLSDLGDVLRGER